MASEEKIDVPDWVQAKRKRGRAEKYGFSRIPVEGSLVVPVVEQTCTFNSFRVMVHKAARELNAKFFVRQREDGAYEVWRER